mmetsp:Transcript_106756/g.267587  ORF Transcript_106756/g.267587 Transcript_106756/m.267587 type:complete len:203 (-) Transcript_106756:1241-1849(-)
MQQLMTMPSREASGQADTGWGQGARQSAEHNKPQEPNLLMYYGTHYRSRAGSSILQRIHEGGVCATNACSANVRAGDLRGKALEELVGQILLGHPLEVLEGAVDARLQGLQGRGQLDVLLAQRLTRGREAEAVHHVAIGRLRIVALVVLRIGPLVHVALVTVGAAVAVQVPLEEGHSLDVQELVLKRRAHNVRVAHTHSTHV